MGGFGSRGFATCDFSVYTLQTIVTFEADRGALDGVRGFVAVDFETLVRADCEVFASFTDDVLKAVSHGSAFREFGRLAPAVWVRCRRSARLMRCHTGC